MQLLKFKFIKGIHKFIFGYIRNIYIENSKESTHTTELLQLNCSLARIQGMRCIHKTQLYLIH